MATVHHTPTQYAPRPVPATVAQLRAIPDAIPDSFPDIIAEQLLAYARQENLEVSRQRQDVRAIYFTSDDEYFFFLTFQAFKRKAQETGRWQPGKVTFHGEGLELIAQATSWFRSSTSDQWVEGGAVITPYWTYYQRQPNSSVPTPPWQLNAHQKLANVAVIKSIYEVLDEDMAQYYVVETFTGYDDDPNLNRFLANDISLGEYRKRQWGNSF